MTGRVSSSGEAGSEPQLPSTHSGTSCFWPADQAAQTSAQHRCLARALQRPHCRDHSAPRLLQGCSTTPSLCGWMTVCVPSCSSDKLQRLQTGCTYPLTVRGQMPKIIFANRQNTICKAPISWRLWGWNSFPCLLSNIWRPPCMLWPMTLSSCHSNHHHITCYHSCVSPCLSLKGHL